MKTAVTPDLAQDKVADFIKSAINRGKAVKIQAEKSGDKWTVTVTRPSAGRAGSN